MKKFKKLGKVGNVVAVLATFLVTFTVVYGAGQYFYSTYGTQGDGALSDGILSAKDWDDLMEDLDNHSCPEQDCPSCPSCNTDCTPAIESKDGSRLIRYNEINMGFYAADGSRPKGYLGLTRIGMSNEHVPCGTAQTDRKWYNLGSYANNSSTLCAVLNTTNCGDAAGSYYVNVYNRWYKISVSCLNIVSGTPYVSIKVTGGPYNVGRYCINMGDSSFSFDTWDIVKK